MRFKIYNISILNNSNTTKKHTVYRRFGFTSEAFIRTDFRCQLSLCKSLSHTWLGSSPQLDSYFRSSSSISPPLCLPALSDSQSITLAFSQSITWFSLQTWSVIADTSCPGLFCSSENSCDAIHFFTMFFYSCSQWSSCFSNVDTFTVLTRYLVSHFGFYTLTTGTRSQTWWRLPTWSRNVYK